MQICNFTKIQQNDIEESDVTEIKEDEDNEDEKVIQSTIR